MLTLCNEGVLKASAQGLALVRFAPFLAITGLNRFALCHAALICFLECCCFSRTSRFPGSAMKVIFQINFQNCFLNLTLSLPYTGLELVGAPLQSKSPSFSLTFSFWWALGTLRRRTGREQEQVGTHPCFVPPLCTGGGC